MRIGHGYDAHRFAAGRPLVLGGVTIPHEAGLLAHSDGDVLLHALCDALLGAAGLGDIGLHFPDSSEQFKDIDSRILLRQVMDGVREMSLRVSNADMTVIAQAPRIRPFISAMVDNLASDLGTDSTRINIKATTTEQMGFTGRGEGIAAHAVVLLWEEP
uniref:2-C-methyl-D-erythritol 2,4-cyclodiphosphate synthase n=1 Tax=Candidatus Kentrum sp. DK TaxID=2126562 RepID=A0A450S0X4_9GAMM|nr:MAG: 2-C-methyl-D-erythritol 2,4-cyclodiphosphate synthase [Candidatus Kentron sp. DK]VFJ56909.1 MAG: 2-C-methyl-D-erythritol 2,4-cyclodiphosphate synthase [Candidatus Kentron sp. DK]